MAGSRIQFEGDDLAKNIAAVPQKISAGLYALTEFYAPQVQAYAQQNASWQDQTSNARNGLTARASHQALSHAIDLWHSVPYGIWLEVRWSGRYAIILPTIEHYGPRVMDAAQGMLERI